MKSEASTLYRESPFVMITSIVMSESDWTPGWARQVLIKDKMSRVWTEEPSMKREPKEEVGGKKPG